MEEIHGTRLGEGVVRKTLGPASIWLGRKRKDRPWKKKIPLKNGQRGFPGGTVVKSLPANAGDTDLSRGPGRSHMPRSN